MKELFIIISSKYRRPVPSKFKEKLMEHFRGSKIKPTKYYLLVASQKNRKLCMRNAAAKLIFIIHTFNVIFINKSHSDMKRRCTI